MTVYELLRPLLTDKKPPKDAPVGSLTDRTDEAEASSLFFCIKGARADGHELAMRAYRGGCRLFVAEHPLSLPSDALVYLVKSTRYALGVAAHRFYGSTSEKMHLVGITGTKGKTTTASLLYQILTGAGRSCGYVGTNGILYGDVKEETKNTTPDPLTLNRTLAKMRERGVDTVILEVSSQAILQHRVAGLRFESALFTNLFPDHIGQNEHPTMENYRECKHRLFVDYGVQTAILNADSPDADGMLADTSAKRRIFCSSLDASADYFAADLRAATGETLGVSFTVKHCASTQTVHLPMLGKINAYNALLAIATANSSFGVSLEVCAQALADASVAGRCETIVLPNGASAVIDYAHNGGSLQELLLSLREYAPRRLICLFGSVGERTQLRRRELGTVAARLSDLCILTSDNPGAEDPMEIIEEIAAAFEGSDTPYQKIPDRKDAIRAAVALTHPDDILVLAGKGHESYQLVGGEKIPFSEKEILLSAFASVT